MIGGDENIVRKIRPILNAMGTSITVVGPNGSGSVAKLANQIMVNLNIAAVSEAFSISYQSRC